MLDEYVYLGGVPIFVVRAAMDHGSRKADFTGWCARRNEPGYCGLTQVVSDEMGRPLMALDQGMRVIGVGEYDAFGYRNRVRVPGQETNHPADQIEVELATKLGRAQTGVESAVRARVSFFDATVKLGQVPRVELRESGSNVALSSASGPLPMMVTPFHRGSSFSVVYVPDGSGGDGAVLDGFEYDRLSSSAAVQYFPPLRFPGQYYDEESDLHENWNRYFDPGTGRYLSPEPLLRKPNLVVGMAGRALPMPAYSYAANNPLKYVDVEGNLILHRTRIGSDTFDRSACGAHLAACNIWDIGELDYVTDCRSYPATSCGSSGRWGFDVKVRFDTRFNFNMLPETPVNMSVAAGRTVGEHEELHRSDILQGLRHINSWVQTEGFESRAACNQARDEIVATLRAFLQSQVDQSLWQRDP